MPSVCYTLLPSLDFLQLTSLTLQEASITFSEAETEEALAHC